MEKVLFCYLIKHFHRENGPCTMWPFNHVNILVCTFNSFHTCSMLELYPLLYIYRRFGNSIMLIHKLMRKGERVFRYKSKFHLAMLTNGICSILWFLCCYMMLDCLKNLNVAALQEVHRGIVIRCVKTWRWNALWFYWSPREGIHHYHHKNYK